MLVCRAESMPYRGALLLASRKVFAENILVGRAGNVPWRAALREKGVPRNRRRCSLRSSARTVPAPVRGRGVGVSQPLERFIVACVPARQVLSINRRCDRGRGGGETHQTRSDHIRSIRWYLVQYRLASCPIRRRGGGRCRVSHPLINHLLLL